MGINYKFRESVSAVRGAGDRCDVGFNTEASKEILTS
jgi:hypothetical protein